MSLIELFEKEYKGKAEEVCERLDNIRMDYVTDEDKAEHDGMDTLEIAQELYHEEGLSHLALELTKELNAEATDDDKLEFAEYIGEGDWAFAL